MHIKTQRRCIACRQPLLQSEMIRICKIDGKVLIDKDKKCEGRGAYVCKNENCIKKTVKNKLINRAFRIPADEKIYAELEDMIDSKNG